MAPFLDVGWAINIIPKKEVNALFIANFLKIKVFKGFRYKKKQVVFDTAEEYGEDLEGNIENLLIRMKKFSYKPYPVRRAYIPKGNGKMRGLGIPSFEDKVVQGEEILEAIYEPKFKEFSFGFRPNRSCHDAIQRVNKHIMADKVNYILDADIKGFFDNIDHEWMIKFLEHDIADKNFIRYSKRNVKIYLKLKIGRKNAIVLEKWSKYDRIQER